MKLTEKEMVELDHTIKFCAAMVSKFTNEKNTLMARRSAKHRKFLMQIRDRLMAVTAARNPFDS